MRKWVVPLSGFVAIAVVSGALAQTVEGIDIGAIKARVQEEISAADPFVAQVAKRGDEFRDSAEDSRKAGMEQLAKISPDDLPKGPVGDINFDEIVAGAAANASNPGGEAPLFMVFVSLSMPQASLRAIIADTTKAGGVVVFRGFPGNSAKVFTQGLLKVVSEQDQMAHIGVDPRLFRAFDVKAAPTFVVASSDFDLCDGFNCSSAVPEFDRMIGNVSVEYVLESFANGRGPGAAVAAIALRNMKKTL